MHFEWASGISINEAKQEASRKAWKELERNKLFGCGSRFSTCMISGSLTFHDKMAKLCHEKFDSLIADISVNLDGPVVIAGIVMESTITRTFEIISLASGNRSIRKGNLRTDGQALMDSHAEILASRGMRRFLYDQLSKLSRGEKSYVLQRHEAGKVEVVPDIKFHLYISTAPCGDGAVFTCSTGQSEEEPDSLYVKKHNPSFVGKKQGRLRTKGEQIPTNKMHVSHHCQAMDAVRGREGLLVMSCSDKICKWNMLGMQGALLASLMKPVYFSSITIGTFYNHGHMARAMCCRLENDNVTFRDGYKVNHPLLGVVSRKDHPRQSIKICTPYSINWNISDIIPEMTNGNTGLTHSGGYSGTKTKSRLCKLQLLQHYKKVCKYFQLLHMVKGNYWETKKASTRYQSSKEDTYGILHRKGYGTWIGMPKECQEFSTTTFPF
ncbi:double-stranded RNA-specific adenosine deaminase-like [Ylistrum balloti]|uniref:double-stranded RNA-specific adenosine deaminase-like n=1 Tax=Ylistrum balloti TaxID=509963 RepID=UPI002905910F|nr:double-stranded RNA-specific adenosine deaminase-like [Ylistrum balloti]